MDQIKKMLRAVINGQSAVKQELLWEIKKTNNEVGLFRNGTRGDLEK